METREINKDILRNWAKTKKAPQLELAFKAEVASGTVAKLFRGICPGTQKVRIKIASVIGVTEDDLFPLVEISDQAA